MTKDNTTPHVYAIPGDVFGERSYDLKDEIMEIASQNVFIILDFAKVGIIDSIGLGVLLNAHQELKKRGGKLQLINPDETVRQLLEVTHLDRYIEIL
jgi:anti-sigma B factor antagonist